MPIIIIYLLGIVALSVTSNQQVAGQKNAPVHHDESLGTGFDISQEQLASSTTGTPLKKGATIFKTLEPSCFRTKILNGLTTQYFKYYKNTASLMETLGTSAGLSPPFISTYSLKTSLDAVLSTKVGNEHEISGTTLHIDTYTKSNSIDKSCQNQELDDEILADLEMLDETIKFPHEKNSWKRYQHFLSKYGSHYVSEVIYGASIKQYAFTNSSEHYAKNDFSLQACLGLAGPLNIDMFKVCSQYSKTDQKTSSSSHIHKHLVLLGGSDKTRNQLHRSRTPKIIEKFMNEGREYEVPVSYKFQSILDLLDFNTDLQNQTANLKSYVEGFLNYDCSYKQENDVELQKFELDTVKSRRYNYSQYVCTIAPSGCQKNSDCHVSIGGCKCYGDSCVKHSRTHDMNGKEKQVAEIHTNRSDNFAENCSLSPTYSYLCHCTPLSGRKEVWSSVQSTAVLRKRKNRARAKAKARVTAHFKD